MNCLMVLMMAHLRADPVASRMGYHTIDACVICGFAMTAITDAARAGLTCLGVLAVVVGWMFDGSGCHATSKGA